jgi:serine phosphatase RsbU (regulator of sigma subunit)
MKKLALMCFLFLIATSQSVSQDKTIDSLKLALKKATHDTTRCNILNALIEAEANDTIWPIYNDQLLKLSQKNMVGSPALKKFYLKHLADATNNLGVLTSNQGNNNEALEYYFKGLKMQEEIGSKMGIATTLNNIGLIYKNRGDIKKALECYTKSLKMHEQIDNKIGIANALNNIGLIYNHQGDVGKALEYLDKTLKMYEEIGNKYGIATSFNNIGFIYNNQGDFKKALEYMIKSMNMYDEMGDKSGAANSLSNIGPIYRALGDMKKALDYSTKSLKLSEEIGDKNLMANSLNNIGYIYQIQRDPKKALEYYFKSLKLYEEMGDKDGVSNALHNIGDIHRSLGNTKMAIEFAEKSMVIAKELASPQRIYSNALSLYKINKDMGNAEKALGYYEEYITMRDSINNQKTKKASIKSQFKYEYEKKAAADSVKVAEERKIVVVQLKQEKTQRLALYGGLVLVVLFAGFMFNRFKISQKQKQTIELKEKETQSQNAIITQQKHLVEEKHLEITDSISYAERIQRSFLASQETLQSNLNDFFILFKPKAVVSGDFYWASKLSNGNFALTVADSTGHGVPGAIMSLLNVTSLEKAIEHQTNPAEILNHTRLNIIERLKKDGSAEGGKDGMDCSLLVFDFPNQRLHIAAANNPVWIIRNNELKEIKPDKMPVGKNDRDTESFTLHTLDLQAGDTIYTLTDGFPDQFGGPNGKKFMSKKLKDLLVANVHLSIPQQQELLDSTFKNWLGVLEQIDDVCVMGIRI